MGTKGWGLAEAEAWNKPDGGYRFMTVAELCMAWALYREGCITARALRVYFATQEMAARRCVLKPKQRARFTREEVRELVGRVGDGKVREALNELAQAGLVIFSAEELRFAKRGEDLAGTPPATLPEMLAQFKRTERAVPVPRRLVRLLAKRAGRGFVATSLAHVLRCMRFVRGRGCVTSGLCSPRWVAEVFGVSLAAVKAARGMLEEDRLLLREETPRWVRRRYGSRVSINPAWCEAEAGAESKPQPKSGSSLPISAPKSGLSDSQLEPSSTYKNQKPAERRPTGLYEKDQNQRRPRLQHIEPEDLRDVGRLGVLFSEAVAKDLVDGSENSFYEFAALAERAKRVGKNPPAVFATLLRGGHRHFVASEDEDRALRRIKAFRDGPQVPRPRELSQEEREAARRRELRRQVDELLRREGSLRAS